MKRAIILLKAAIPGGAAADLFAAPVPVKGYVREGVAVAPHTAIRHKAPAAPPAAPRPAPPPPAADLAGGRATYPDGRMIPQPGDKVRRGVPGIFGIPVMLEGVVHGRTVRITAGPTNRKTDALSPAWTVIGDPAVERIAAERRAKHEAERAAEAAKRQAEADAEAAERMRLITEIGLIDPATLTPGDMIADPEGRQHIVTEIYDGGAYGHAIGDDYHSGGLGELAGWTRLDAPPPPGSIIESNRGAAKRRTESGAWEPVIWNDHAGGWVPEADIGPPLTDEDVQTFARAAVEIMRTSGGRIGHTSRSALDQLLREEKRALRQADEERVVDAIEAMRGATPPKAAGAAASAAPAAPKAVIIAPDALLAAERAKLARYQAGAYVRDDIRALTEARVNADPSKWRVGMGASFKVAGARGMDTSRGFRVVEVDAANKRLRLRLARDAGFADAMPGETADVWVWMGEAQRVRADDGPEVDEAPAKAKRDPAAPKVARKAPDYTAMNGGALDSAITAAERVSTMLNGRALEAGWHDKTHSQIIAMANDSPLADAIRRNSLWLNALRAERDARRRYNGTTHPLPMKTKMGFSPREAPIEGVAPVSFAEANAAHVTHDAGVIHRAYTGDYASQIHYARDARGRVWRRVQRKDPRYGYKWGAWTLERERDIPERAMRTNERARLPGA